MKVIRWFIDKLCLLNPEWEQCDFWWGTENFHSYCMRRRGHFGSHVTNGGYRGEKKEWTRIV